MSDETQRVNVRTPAPVWRDGDRIRRTDGLGYSDRVTDDEIRQHALSAMEAGHDYDIYWFAMATLALRKWEGATTTAS